LAQSTSVVACSGSTATTTWDEIGRVAAIAAIRTFLTFFLDRDIDAFTKRQRERA